MHFHPRRQQIVHHHQPNVLLVCLVENVLPRRSCQILGTFNSKNLKKVNFNKCDIAYKSWDFMINCETNKVQGTILHKYMVERLSTIQQKLCIWSFDLQMRTADRRTLILAKNVKQHHVLNCIILKITTKCCSSVRVIKCVSYLIGEHPKELRKECPWVLLQVHIITWWEKNQSSALASTLSGLKIQTWHELLQELCLFHANLEANSH